MAIGNTSRPARLSAVLLLAALTLTVQAGPLEPPVPPGMPTMHPIDEVEPRIPIYPDDLPLTITGSGSYYLAHSIDTMGTGIVVSALDVTIDLMGFALTGGTGPAIDATNASGLTVRNGEIAYWGGAGVKLGHDSVAVDLVVRNNTGSGIVGGFRSRVVRCTSVDNEGHGIIVNRASIVEDSVASGNYENGIWVEQPTGSAVSGRVSDCIADANWKNGIRVDGNTLVRNNVCRGNDYSVIYGKAGIWVNGDSNRIEGNHLVDNNIGLDISGSYNFIGGNTMRGNVTQNWRISGTPTGNLFRVWTVASPGEPGHWDNIDLGSAP